MGNFIAINAQTIASNYCGTSGTEIYTKINNLSPTEIHDKNTDDALSGSINIGFDFDFEWTTYTQFKASSNGWITLNTNATDYDRSNSITSPASNLRPLIAPLWDDIALGNANNSECSYLLSGTAGSRILTVEWFKADWDYSSDRDLDFQCKLYEGSNKITFHYNRRNAPSSPSASVGILGASSYLCVNEVSSSATFSNSSPQNSINDVTDNTKLTFTPQYTITYNGNSSDGGATSATTGCLDLNVASNGYTRTNYTFTGWNTASNGSGTAYAVGATYSSPSDITLHAQWVANQPPTISSFTPSSVCANQTVTITGTSLSSATSVTVGGTAATITSNTSTQIIATVGSGTTGL